MAGRPEGSFKNPELSYQQEMLAWLNMMRENRTSLQLQQKLYAERIADVVRKTAGLDVDEQVKITGALIDLNKEIARVIENGLKQRSVAQSATESPEDVLKMLEGGKGG